MVSQGQRVRGTARDGDGERRGRGRRGTGTGTARDGTGTARGGSERETPGPAKVFSHRTFIDRTSLVSFRCCRYCGFSCSRLHSPHDMTPHEYQRQHRPPGRQAPRGACATVPVCEQLGAAFR